MIRKSNVSPQARKALRQFKIEMSKELGTDRHTVDKSNVNSVVINAYKDRISYDDYLTDKDLKSQK